MGLDTPVTGEKKKVVKKVVKKKVVKKTSSTTKENATENATNGVVANGGAEVRPPAQAVQGEKAVNNVEGERKVLVKKKPPPTDDPSNIETFKCEKRTLEEKKVSA